MMNVVDFEDCGSSDVLEVVRREMPKLGRGEILINIVATSVTGFDVWRRSNSKLLNGVNTLLGMECSGIIVDVAYNHGSDHRVGDQVCALVEGGGYAEYVAVPAWRVLPIPNWIQIDHAATLPYTVSVVWHSLFRVGNLRGILLEKGKCSILIHEGGGEFGPLAIQLAQHHGCTVFASSTFREEMMYCKALGAVCIAYDKDFVGGVLKKTEGNGVDIVFDPFGARVSDNLRILSHGGTLVISGQTELDGVLLNHRLVGRRQIKLVGHIFVYLTTHEKQQILREIVSQVWPLYESGELPVNVYHRRYRFNDAAAAHLAMEQYVNLGNKIILLPHTYHRIHGIEYCILVMIFIIYIWIGIKVISLELL